MIDQRAGRALARLSSGSSLDDALRFEGLDEEAFYAMAEASPELQRKLEWAIELAELVAHWRQYPQALHQILTR